MLPTDYEYSRSNPDKLQLPIQMQLTAKLQTFSLFFIAFLEYSLNCEHLEKKSEPHGFSISEVIDSQKRVYLRAKWSCFWKLFGSERGNVSLKLLKSAEKYHYPTLLSV